MEQLAKKMGEKRIKKVLFTFEDGSEKVLEGKELENWEAICLGLSDYLLPGNPDHVLAVGYAGAVLGFVPPEVIGTPGGRWKKLE